MQEDNIIDELIKLPNQFNTILNKSIYDLLRDTGYFEIYDQILVENIYKKLSVYPSKFVEDWLSYSENKRSNTGWYFKSNEKQKYVVGMLDSEGENNHFEYKDCIEACAAFIKNEIEDIRTC